jgi:hypothetical protein
VYRFGIAGQHVPDRVVANGVRGIVIEQSSEAEDFPVAAIAANSTRRGGECHRRTTP